MACKLITFGSWTVGRDKTKHLSFRSLHPEVLLTKLRIDESRNLLRKIIITCSPGVNSCRLNTACFHPLRCAEIKEALNKSSPNKTNLQKKKILEDMKTCHAATQCTRDRKVTVTKGENDRLTAGGHYKIIYT